MWATAGGSPAHGAIATNAVIALGNALRGTPCRPYGSGLKVRIPRKGGAVYVVSNPSVIVEVLSPGTESFERGEKFAGYRSIEGLRHFVMLSSHAVEAEQYVRADDGTWNLRALGPGDVQGWVRSRCPIPH